MTDNDSHNAVLLRDVDEGDLAIFFEHQRDPVAIRMAAFQPRDRRAFMTHWTKILNDDSVIKKTILFRDEVAGNMVSFERSGRRLVGYWLGRPMWGKGIATRALSDFVGTLESRPLYAHVAKRNKGSIRVLEKCGFTRYGEDRAVSPGAGEVVEEFVFRLE